MIPDCYVERAPFTVFVIQSKLVYLNAVENKRLLMFFCHSLYPLLKKGDICLYFRCAKDK